MTIGGHGQHLFPRNIYFIYFFVSYTFVGSLSSFTLRGVIDVCGSSAGYYN